MKTIRDVFENEMVSLDKLLKGLEGNQFTPLEKLREETWLIRAAQKRIHEVVAAYSFSDASEEIAYHKNLYPRLRALHIFRVEVYLLEKDLPPAGVDFRREHYRLQLEMIFSYVRRYEFLYSYYKLKATELDTLYFTSAGNKQSVLLPVLAEPEVAHTTETGYLFARFAAYELLFRHIVGRLENVAQPFRWTGETVNLIELLHGIHLNGQVNDGEVGIVEFFNGMGEFFGVDLGVPKKGLEALMKRKKLSKTHFTDRMQSSLQSRMDEEFDLERQKRQGRKTGY